MDSKIIVIICLVAGVSVLATIVTLNETKSPEEKPYKKSLSGSQVMEISDMITEGIHIKTYAEYEKY